MATSTGLVATSEGFAGTDRPVQGVTTVSTVGLTHQPAARSRNRLLDRTAVARVGFRRALQIALGLIWLVDAGLQYQSYMFGRTFVTQTLEPAAAGTPYVVEHPSLWADHVMLHHIALYNALFATVQLLIALAILFRPTVRIGLAGSIVWGLGVWWLAEGIGGITNNTSPVMGAPGAVLIYVLLSIFLWPRGEERAEPSVSEGGPLGRLVPRLTWVALWTLLLLLGLESTNRSPSALHDVIKGMADGEPAWIASMDNGIARPLAHHGTEVSVALAVLFGLIALGGLVLPLRRPAVVLGIVLGLAIWVAEDFGQVLTGQATDVNSGLLLVLLAVSFWPLARRSATPASADPLTS